ncbi:hypothetical protein [Carboxylicivirga sp. N1Y90]|uniref:hypothetical protein n=1 Tax=Carboxylicivirga fragile TaxID=3417571 RepID=UPI003D34A0BA|nr:hypothetical protein [Marinilabiliaceae bacterium N1Y90]
MPSIKNTFQIALICFFSVFIFISCEKEDSNDESPNPFVGVWKIEYSSSNWEICTFNEDLSYESEYHELNPSYEQYDTGTYTFSTSEKTVTFKEGDETWTEDYEFISPTTLDLSGDIYIKQ